MDDQANSLLNPSWAQNPPVKLDINAKILGIVIAVLSALGVLGSLLALLGLLGGSALLAAAGFGGILFIAIIGTLVGGVADLLSLVGGWQMYQGNVAGKRLVIYGLALALAGDVVSGFGYLRIGNVILPLLVILAIYYLVVISRFPGEAAKTTS
jgi:hypothetical protein